MPKPAVTVNFTRIASIAGGVTLPAQTPVPVITAVNDNYLPAVRSSAISMRVEGGVATVATVKPVPSLVPAQDESLMLEAERIALEMIKDTGLPKSHIYRCIFEGCNKPILPFDTALSYHLMYCHLQAAQYVCSHCKKQNTFTTVQTFIQHLSSHEAQRVFCFVCDYKGSSPPDVIKHVREKHKASKPAKLYLNPQKNNPINDIMLFAPDVPTEAEKKAYYRKLIDLYNHKMRIALLKKKTHFAPEESEALPKQAVFSQTISCSDCQYSTRVRLNMYRHLKGHINALHVSIIDLEHFDRMRNPATSSQEDDDLIQSLCFVQESKRYICGAPDCRHLTINELMLHNHLVTLHSDVMEYKCPHCPAVFAGKLNTSNVLDHLKLHDKELYRCSICQIFLNNLKEMNQHITEKHANGTLLVIRDVEVNSLKSGLACLADEKETNVAIKRPKPVAVKAFKCGFRGCAYVDDFGAGIVSHFKSDHPNEKPLVRRNFMSNPAQSRFDYFLKYACYYCCTKADTVHELLEHWGQMHRVSGPRSQDKPFLFRASKIILCFYCRKGAQMPEMKSHYVTRHPEKQPIYLDFRNPKQCAECDFVMGTNRHEMVLHFAEKHKVGNEYSRGWIDFLTDDILDKILKLNSTMYGCGKCDFTSVKPSDFDAHYAATHPGQSVAFNEYPLIQQITYHCTYNNCTRQLTDEISLVQHILFHVPVFECCCLSGVVNCNVQFHTFTMLLEHFKTTHSNEDMRYALKTPEEYKQVLRMVTLQFWNGFTMSLEDARQAGNKYGSNDGIFKLVNQMCQNAVLAALQQ